MEEYFSHDYNAREDEKIMDLMGELNWAGYGLYWGIIELLYKNDGKMSVKYERIAFALKTHPDSIKQLVEEFDLFVVKDGVFYSETVLKRLGLRKQKSAKARDSALKRWDNTNAMRTQCDSNASKVKKSKEKINITFGVFWDLYNKKVGDKAACEKKWNKLKDIDREKIIDTLPLFLDNIRDKQFQPHPSSYLNQRRWEDEPAAGTGEIIYPPGYTGAPLKGHKADYESMNKKGWQHGK